MGFGSRSVKNRKGEEGGRDALKKVSFGRKGKNEEGIIILL